MDQRLIVLLAAALTLPIASPANAIEPFDDDGGSGRDAGADRATAVRLDAIGPQGGRRYHAGHLDPVVDEVDVYVLEVSRWTHAELSVWSRTGIATRIVSPSGVFHPASGPLLMEPGEWAFFFELPREVNGQRVAPPTDYTLEMWVWPANVDDASSGRDASADRPVAVEPGAHSGSVGPNDLEDVYTFDARAGERVSVEIVSPGARPLDLLLDLRSGNRVYVSSWLPSGDRILDHLAISDESLSISVRYVGWDRCCGNYTLTLATGRWASMDPQGLPRMANVSGAPAVVAMTPESDGVDGFGSGFGTSGWYRFNSSGVHLIRSDLKANSPTAAKDADGFAYVSTDQGIDRAAPTGLIEPVSSARGAFAFGPDGELWTTQGRYLHGGDPAEPLAAFPETVSALAFSPDGEAYGLGWSTGRLYRADLDSGSAEEIARTGAGSRSIAFDAAGNAYVFNPRYGVVLRIEPDNGAVDAVARVSKAGGYSGALAIGGGKLFVASPGLSVLDLGIEGFLGFRPSYVPRLPDLSVRGIQERHLSDPIGADRRELVVQVSNEGALGVKPDVYFEVCRSRLAVGEACSPLATDRPDTVSDIGPGESRSLRFVYDAWDQRVAGEVRIVAKVSSWPAREIDLSDNQGDLLTCWKVCGLGFGV